MPFLALKDDSKVIPEEIEDNTELVCFDCSERVKPRQSHDRNGSFVARHFWHPDGAPEGCEAAGGESRLHQRMKSIAASKAKSAWPDATVSLEKAIGERRTDVLVEFDELHRRYGNGIAIEVQHKHRDKDKRAVEEEFQDHRYTTLWLREEHYDNKKVDFQAGDWTVWWAHAVPDQDEWDDLHGIVHWLRQEQSPPVEIEVPLPEPYYEWAENTLREVWRRAQHDAWETLVEARLGTKPYLYLSKSPTGNIFLQLAKMDYTGRIYVHAPFEITESNANKLHYFAQHIEGLADEHDNFVDESTGPWETEKEVWLDSWSERINSLIKTVRTPSGEVAIELKKIESGDFESVTTSPNDLFRTINALHDFADEVGSLAESDG